MALTATISSNDAGTAPGIPAKMIPAAYNAARILSVSDARRTLSYCASSDGVTSDELAPTCVSVRPAAA
jgi:hypothetical protein